MKFRQLEWLWEFILTFPVFAAVNALYKLHSVGRPVLGVISESIFVAAGVSLLKYMWKNRDREIHLPKWFGGQ